MYLILLIYHHLLAKGGAHAVTVRRVNDPAVVMNLTSNTGGGFSRMMGQL